MLSKKEIKDIQSLGSKKQRDEQACFIAEGPKIVEELLKNPSTTVQKIYATSTWLLQNPTLTQDRNIQVITETELGKISALQTPHDVLGVFKQFSQKVPTVSANHFCLYLDAIQDPGNLGTLLRIGDWFGIDYFVCSPGCADVYNPKVIQSSMGSIGRIQIYYDYDLQWLSRQSTTTWAATLQGSSIYNIQKKDGGVLIVGNESKGIRPQFLSLATEQIMIPRRGGAESLNAAVAAGIILSHLIK